MSARKRSRDALSSRQQTGAFAHVAALALLWRSSPGGWPSLVALLAVLAPLPAWRGRGRWLAALRVLVALAGTLGEVLLVRAAGAGEAGLGVVVARGLVLAGAVALRSGVGGASAVVVPVALAVLGAGIFAPPSATLPELLCALAALGAAAAQAALARDDDVRRAARASRRVSVARSFESAARRPVLGLSLAHGALTAALFLVTLAFRQDATSDLAPDNESGGAAARSRRDPGARTTNTVALSPEIRFDGSGAPDESGADVVASVQIESQRREGGPLLLRATALEVLDEDGFRPPEDSGGDRGRGTTAFPVSELCRIDRPRSLKLEVDLGEARDGFLLVMGTPKVLEGARATQDSAGNLLLGRRIEVPLIYVLRGDECLDDDDRLGELAASDAPHLLALPPSLRGDRELRALALRLTRGALSPHRRARALERALSRDFEYDLSRTHRARGVSRTLRSFLLEERRGACAEFAVAMVVLLRLAGVPARVAVGYRIEAHEKDAEGNWPARRSDAHAWVEVPLRGAGFVTYDPTAPLRAKPDDLAAGKSSAASSWLLAGSIDRILPRRTAALLAIAIVVCLVAGAAVSRLVRAARSRRARVRPGSGSLAPELVDACAALLALVERRGFVLGGPETLLAFAQRRAERGDAAANDRALLDAIRLYYAVRFSGEAVGEVALSRLAARVREAR